MSDTIQQDSSLSAALDAAIESRLERPKSGGSKPAKTTIDVEAASSRASVQLEDIDRLGVLVGPVAITRDAGGAERGLITSQAEAVSRRITYLQEPLSVIETDPIRGRAVLRSAAPSVRGRTRDYNEAVLDGGRSITVRRFRAESGSRRRGIPSNLSRETLGRLADDLSDILQNP